MLVPALAGRFLSTVPPWKSTLFPFLTSINKIAIVTCKSLDDVMG